MGTRCEDIFTVLQDGYPRQTSLRYVEDSDDDEPRPCTLQTLQPLGMYSVNGQISSVIDSTNDPISSTSKITTFQATFGHIISVSRTRTRDNYLEYADFDDELD